MYILQHKGMMWLSCNLFTQGVQPENGQAHFANMLQNPKTRKGFGRECVNLSVYAPLTFPVYRSRVWGFDGQTSLVRIFVGLDGKLKTLPPLPLHCRWSSCDCQLFLSQDWVCATVILLGGMLLIVVTIGSSILQIYKQPSWLHVSFSIYKTPKPSMAYND